MTLDTAATETPACSATVRMVTRPLLAVWMSLPWFTACPQSCPACSRPVPPAPQAPLQPARPALQVVYNDLQRTLYEMAQADARACWRTFVDHVLPRAADMAAAFR